MAFASTVSNRSIHGNHRVVWGTYTNGANDSGGDINTGLDAVFGFSMISTGMVGTTVPKYSVSGGTVTVITDNDSDGNWFAFGL
jgi:hypothetical protein